MIDLKKEVIFNKKLEKVYACEFCGFESTKAFFGKHECREKREAIDEYHEEEARVGLL